MSTRGEPTPAEQAKVALRRARMAAIGAATVSTILSAQGMVSVGHDVLGLWLPVAIALTGFLELSLIATALLAHASSLEGRPAGLDGWATWGISLISGIFSAVHELMNMTTHKWEADPPSLLAAAFRLVAPLVAAFLWHRVLVRARYQLNARTLSEIMRDRRLHAVALAALAVRRAATAGDARAVNRARRRLDRAHRIALRHVPATDQQLADDLALWLAAVGSVDDLPQRMTSSSPEPAEVAERAPVEPAPRPDVAAVTVVELVDVEPVAEPAPPAVVVDVAERAPVEPAPRPDVAAVTVVELVDVEPVAEPAPPAVVGDVMPTPAEPVPVSVPQVETPAANAPRAWLARPATLPRRVPDDAWSWYARQRAAGRTLSEAECMQAWGKPRSTAGTWRRDCQAAWESKGAGSRAADVG